jgi:peptidase YpeB-like protein
MRRLASMLSCAILLGGSSAALAADTQPVMLSKQQLIMQDQETRVLNLLSGNGYTDIGPLEQAGNTYTTTATKDGKQMHVTVDPGSGTVSGM